MGVEPSADPASLRRAYRKLAQKYHPDINPDPTSHDQMARINQAFETLIDPVRRMEYDALLAGGLRLDADPPQRHEAPKPVQVRLLQRIRAHRTPVYGLSFVPDSHVVVTSAFDNELASWDVGSGAVLRRMKVEGGALSTIRALGRERIVAAGSSENQVTLAQIGKGGAASTRTALTHWVSA
ncbi:MAG TPA: DnaJ domain-containing protein, partial [Fimbriimonadaceae bacterium]|nr:DnaJ domain-containing protein [Fimbriimonadaceae bacterium]